MRTEIGARYLITTDDWFYAPDGQSYKAVYGTIKEQRIHGSRCVGFGANPSSAGLYVNIGRMTIFNDSIKYAIRADECSRLEHSREVDFENTVTLCKVASRIYFAD